MKKVLSLVLVIVMLSTGLSVFARASNYIDSYSIGISAEGGGVIKVNVSIGGTHNKMTKIGFPTIALYELNGNEWTPVKAVGSVYNSNATAGSHSYSFTYDGTVGKKYYASASYWAGDSTGHDTRSANSLTATAT